ATAIFNSAVIASASGFGTSRFLAAATFWLRMSRSQSSRCSRLSHHQFRLRKSDTCSKSLRISCHDMLQFVLVYFRSLTVAACISRRLHVTGLRHERCNPHPPVLVEPKPTMLVKASERQASTQHRGECNDESSRSWSSRFGAFSERRISPDGKPQHSYRSALQLCRSGLVGTAPRDTAWVRATHLPTTTVCPDSCLSGAADEARLLHRKVSRGFTAV